MHLSSMVEMIESGLADRVLFSDGTDDVAGRRFGELVRSGAASFGHARAVVYAGENHPLLPAIVFACAWAGTPFVPVNFRLEDERLNRLVGRQPGALVIADERTAGRIVDADNVLTVDAWRASLSDEPGSTRPADDDDDAVAVTLYTSGTTSEPKAALLRHRHLMSYLLGTVEFGGAGDEEAVLIAVPPYHIAGIANMFSNLFAGRRLVYLRRFDPDGWLETIRREQITHAMVVPTMLARIVEYLDGHPAEVPSLRSLSYGGARVADRVIREALRLFPDVGFVNAYGLTETASTIAILGPDDHRAAVESGDPDVRRRLASAGRLLPSVEVEIRDETESPLPPGQAGLIHVRGEQISGEYATGSVLDADGWFCTRDRGWVDDDGFLFIDGRVDDTIIRGGENIAPAEIEEVLLSHPAIREACVVGVPDEEWGERIVAVVVLVPDVTASADELCSLVRRELRGSKTPDQVEFRLDLPHTETGKLLRRVVIQELSDTAESEATSTRSTMSCRSR